MQIVLDADIEARVRELLTSCPHKTPAEFVNKVLRLNLDPYELHRRHEELKRLLQEGVESAESGECLDVDEVFDALEIELFGHRLADEVRESLLGEPD